MAELRYALTDRELHDREFRRQQSLFRDWVGPTHDELNPKRIIPVGPGYDWGAPHARGG